MRDVSYTYDVDSNRLTETDEIDSKTKTYSYYTGTQRLERVTNADGSYTEYTWTDNGQQQSKKKYNASGTLSLSGSKSASTQTTRPSGGKAGKGSIPQQRSPYPLTVLLLYHVTAYVPHQLQGPLRKVL